MAINPSICIQYKSDASDIIITDDTGEYNAQTNTGGYGAPNEERANLAGVLVCFYQPYNGDRKLLLPLDEATAYNASYTNQEKSKFTVPYYKDGWYQYYYILVPTSITPAEGAVIYSTSQGAIKQYNSNLQLVDIFDYDAFLDPTTYEMVLVEEFPEPKLKNMYSNLGLEYFECKQCSECNCEDKLKEVVKLEQAIKSSKAQFEVSKYEAQRMIEKLTKQYKL